MKAAEPDGARVGKQPKVTQAQEHRRCQGCAARDGQRSTSPDTRALDEASRQHGDGATLADLDLEILPEDVLGRTGSDAGKAGARALLHRQHGLRAGQVRGVDGAEVVQVAAVLDSDARGRAASLHVEAAGNTGLDEVVV